MNKTDLLLMTDSVARADAYLQDVVAQITSKTFDADSLKEYNEEIIRLLGRSSALVGNMRMHMNEVCEELRILDAQGLLEEK